jgi:hypothetical protein
VIDRAADIACFVILFGLGLTVIALDAQHDTASMVIGFWAGWRFDG